MKSEVVHLQFESAWKVPFYFQFFPNLIYQYPSDIQRTRHEGPLQV